MASDQQPPLPLMQAAQPAPEDVEDIGLAVPHFEPQFGVPGVDSIPQQDDPSTRPPPAKRLRRRYDNNFKAGVLEHLKVSGAKLSAVAKQHGIPENTLREWTKVSVVQSIESARRKSCGSLKANMFDPMHRLAESVLHFFAENEKQPAGVKQAVTTKLIVAKGMEARKRLLELHEVSAFLEPREKKALEIFTGSDSWAKKFSKRHNLKLSGARVKDLREGDVRAYSEQINQMVARFKQAGSAYKEVALLLAQAGEKLETVGNIRHTTVSI